MSVRKLYTMQNNFTQVINGSANTREEGICTITALQWCKKCLERGRGLGNYDELSLDDHQLSALMRSWRRYDNQPDLQSHAMGLRCPNGDEAVTTLQEVHDKINASASKIGLFWISFHTMAYRVSSNRASECEWFDNNFGCWVSNDAREMNRFMRDEFKKKYSGYPVLGVRILEI